MNRTILKMDDADLILDLKKGAEALQQWLFEDVLPLWSTEGLDDVNGGFAEAISLEAKDTLAPRRGRLNPRMTYVFCEAGKMGWKGPWQTAARHGLDHMTGNYKTADGHYGTLASVNGALIDDSFDFYNQAFALLAFASVAAIGEKEMQEVYPQALALLDLLQTRYKHPEHGFEEAATPVEPLCSNPHMHMFEAMLAWEEVDANGPWTAVADEIAELALTRFIDPISGLGEFFNRNWMPIAGEAGERVEPGHQFEWAWLLARWAVLRKSKQALEVAANLHEIGVQHGIDADRQVAIMATDRNFKPIDQTARLWGQTEWMKSSILQAQLNDGEVRLQHMQSLKKSVQALNNYVLTTPRGLWFDKMRNDGTFVTEPAPASSLYHVICAVRTFQEYIDDLELNEL
ncbi:Cellobiose 2-epimerase [Pseudovibrio axinellae]|uniref:Cellobiose 2-epimerase n=1 Tax=Pseudovibrio axinellae TaxID=989403 RepID=A0A165VZS1_9HYPH|nr:AGE family epimerase/isomerase [Pseudovibrio axinellae]KZL15726.1 Cellobiose 2-epimerase [Pseudovibrio axinellae]SER80813.1 mannose-6-phosphate isomerase, type 3 [Pseudovibrio axinellae]